MLGIENTPAEMENAFDGVSRGKNHEREDVSS